MGFLKKHLTAIIVGVIVGLLVSFIALCGRNISDFVKDVFAEKPILKLSITRSPKVYYDNLQEDDQLFHINILNDTKHFLTDINLDIKLPGSIKDFRTYFEKLTKNLNLKLYPDEIFPSDESRRKVPSSKLSITIDELSPHGTAQIFVVCMKLNKDAAKGKPLLTAYKSNITGGYYFRNRMKYVEIATIINLQLFSMSEESITNFYKNYKPEQGSSVLFDIEGKLLWDSDKKERFIFFDIHLRNIEMVLFRDIDNALKFFYSSSEYPNSSIIFKNTQRYKDKELITIALTTSNKEVSLYIAGDLVGKIIKQ